MKKYITIPLSKRSKKRAGEFFAIISSRHEILSDFNWCVSRSKYTSYATRKEIIDGVIHTLSLHREVMALILERELRPEEEVDHKDGNGLNCTDKNLRIATHGQNTMNRGIQKNNTTGYKGVSFYAPTGRYYSRITARGVSYFLGYHDTPELAWEAYCKKADELHKEFANHGRK